MKTISPDKEFRFKQRVPYKKIDSRIDFFKAYGFPIRKEAQEQDKDENGNSVKSENDGEKKDANETNKNKDISETKENSDIIESFLAHRRIVDVVREITVKNSNKTIVKNFGKFLRGRSMREATEKDYLTISTPNELIQRHSTPHVKHCSYFGNFLACP